MGSAPRGTARADLLAMNPAHPIDPLPRGQRAALVLALALLLGLLALACTAREEEPHATAPTEATPAAEARERAATAIAAFRQALLSALGGALQEGPGPAVDMCRVEAPRIAAGLSSDGMRVGRTSHRLRNPKNAPEPWMLPLLEELRAAPPEPGAWRSVDLGERGLGYVEPIHVAAPCLTCHGSAIAAPLLAHIRERYPQDQAVGFEVGELRGLFWAVVAP